MLYSVHEGEQSKEHYAMQGKERKMENGDGNKIMEVIVCEGCVS